MPTIRQARPHFRLATILASSALALAALYSRQAIASVSCSAVLTTQIFSFYETHATRFAAVFDEHTEDDPYLEKFLNAIPAGSSVLDAGCGPGRDMKKMTRHGLTPFGVDLSPAMVELARRNVPGSQIEPMDLRTLRFPEGRFGAILASYSLIHFSKEDSHSVLSEFHRVLASEGKLYLALQFGQGEGEIHSPVSNGNVFISFYDVPVITEFLQRAGFDQVQVIGQRKAVPGVELESDKLYISASRR